MRLLAIVNDDSGLFVARQMAKLAATDGVSTYFALLSLPLNSAFVARMQHEEIFDFVAEPSALFDATLLSSFDAVFFAKPPPGFPTFCKRTRYLEHERRPVIISAFPGLELTPQRGFINRLFCDIIVFNTVADRDVFHSLYGPFAEEKVLLVGHPSLVNRWVQGREERAFAEVSSEETVFLAQSITPQALGQRVELLRAIHDNAIAVPTVVKLRQTRAEAAEHVHRELFGYEAIAQREGIDVPIVFCSMDEVLAQHDSFLSCSSTGVFEAAAMGKRVGLITRIPGWETDRLHVASLGYTLRYGMGIDIGESPKICSEAKRFTEDFCLDEDNALLSLREHISSCRAKRQGLRPMVVWNNAVQQPVDDAQLIRAYISYGNPHKAVFLALVRLLERSWYPLDKSLVAVCLKQLDNDDPARPHVDEILRAEGSPGDISGRIQANWERSHCQVAKPKPKPRPKPKPKPKQQASRASSSSQSISRLGRKMRKLTRDPKSFLRDSRHGLLRAVAGAIPE